MLGYYLMALTRVNDVQERVERGYIVSASHSLLLLLEQSHCKCKLQVNKVIDWLKLGLADGIAKVTHKNSCHLLLFRRAEWYTPQ